MILLTIETARGATAANFSLNLVGILRVENGNKPAMKTLFILLLGAALGIGGYMYYQRTQHPTVGQRVGDAAETTKEAAGEIKDKVVEKSKTVGEHIDDARIITAIKGKYVLEKDLSALAISVSCQDGFVTLSGSAGSDLLIAKARRLAGETSGVKGVSAQLTVKN